MAEVKVYTRSLCGYCTAATQLLSSKGVDFEEIDLSGDDERRRWLAEASGQSTVPQTFIDGSPVGGYSELRALDASGELDTLLGLG